MQQPLDGIIINYISRHIQPKIQLWNGSDKGQLVEAHVFLLKSSLICNEVLHTMHMQHNYIMQVTKLSSTFSDGTLSLPSFPGSLLLENSFNLFFISKISILLPVKLCGNVRERNAKTCNIYYVSVSIFLSTWFTI